MVLGHNLFLQSDPSYNPGLKLVPSSSTNPKQHWRLTQVPGKANVWKIENVADGCGITHLIKADTYWGYGYPYPQKGPSDEWTFIEREGRYSKIKLNDGSRWDYFDACDPGKNDVHFYYDQASISDGPNQCFLFNPVVPPPPPQGSKALDVMFIQDFTGSQQPYINRARNEVDQICAQLLTAGQLAPDKLRFGLIAFRDHPPQEPEYNSFVTKPFDFTTSPDTMASYLASLRATGGGDGPEAQSDALADAVHAAWNDKDDAAKVAILITDAPPHGIGVSGDGFPDGCPYQIDPHRIATRMGKLGITLYVIACEPTMTQCYPPARAFYEGLVAKTGGKVYNLGDDIGGLTKIITGCALQAADSHQLIVQHQATIRNHVQVNSLSVSDAARKLHSELSASNVHHHNLAVDSMIHPDEQHDRATQIWFEAENLKEGREKIQQAHISRINNHYLSGNSPSITLSKDPITLTQVEGIVRSSLARES
ncbi:hypothetical protein B0J17DRAFT_678410 [Rhizoctonia solani]|nr:hypothetical protein B0J17DRAFT_678410 [Rhizoctonia solani]